MPDQLTPAERAAIAAYSGPVQIIPRGVSGLTPELIANGKGPRAWAPFSGRLALSKHRAAKRNELNTTQGA